MNIPQLENFVLVGGTALALQLGHRKSVDIDLFANEEINELNFNDIFSDFENVNEIQKSKLIQIYTINSIKVDFVKYHYPWLQTVRKIDGIRFAGLKDIGAMKLNAIAGRGSRKDFIDVFFLLKEYSLSELLNFYKMKYRSGSEFLVLKSLSWFEDAEEESMPELLHQISWEEMKILIKEEVSRYLKK